MKILVIRVGRVGDMIMVTPALKSILAVFPQADIDVISGAEGRRVLNGFDERIRKIYLYERKSSIATLRRRMIRHEVISESYDYVFCFEVKASFHKFYTGTTAKVYELESTHKVQHYSRHCLDLVEKAYAQKLPEQWAWLPLGKEGVAKAGKQFREHGITDETYVIALHPSFSGHSKRWYRIKPEVNLRSWPTAYFAELARMIRDHADEKELDLKIVMDLLPDERKIGEEIRRASNNAVIMMTPPADFKRYKAVIARVDLLITPNTGPMHLAAALGTKNISLFSGLSPEDCGPYMPADMVTIFRSEDMKDGNKLGLAAIKPQDVFNTVLQHI